ncbi:hypothetical protein [Streptomyces sp. NPDC057686]|uniref:hypothetical protein n=1 Tax=Streptomyces sp. NPDC057686 TaxID=3346212 RepID=UPI00368FEF20
MERTAAGYVAAALIFLQDNVPLTQPLRPEHIKPRLLGHWGSCPGITMVYSALNALVAGARRRRRSGRLPRCSWTASASAWCSE